MNMFLKEQKNYIKSMSSGAYAGNIWIRQRRSSTRELNEGHLFLLLAARRTAFITRFSIMSVLALLLTSNQPHGHHLQ